MQICAQRMLQMRFKGKELTYAFHPVFDPVAVNNRRVTHVAVQRRLGILSQRRSGSYSLNRVTGCFAALEIPGDSRSVFFLSHRVGEYVFSANGALVSSAWGNAPGIRHQEGL